MIPSIIEGDEAELRKRSDWNQIATSTPAYLAFTQARSHRMTGVLQGFFAGQLRSRRATMLISDDSILS
jgi:hypothetical protein